MARRHQPARRLLGVTVGLIVAVAATISGLAVPAQAMTAPSPTSPTAGSITLCAQVAAKAGFSFNRTVGTALGQEPQMVVAVAVAMAESSCDPSATGTNSNGTVDRGLWQINSSWTNVSNACAYQAQCNADAAWNISDHGANWGPWSTFNSGAWENYASAARSVISGGFTFQLKGQSAGTCLDADGTNVGNGGKIFQWSCNASDHFQQWTVVDTVGRLFVLRNVGAGTCLDADGSVIGNGAPIFQWSCNSSDGSQQWWFNGSGRLNSGGQAEAGLQNSHNGTCVDADGSNVGNGGKIFQWSCNGNDGYQEWN